MAYKIDISDGARRGLLQDIQIAQEKNISVRDNLPPVGATVPEENIAALATLIVNLQKIGLIAKGEPYIGTEQFQDYLDRIAGIEGTERDRMRLSTKTFSRGTLVELGIGEIDETLYCRWPYAILTQSYQTPVLDYNDRTYMSITCSEMASQKPLIAQLHGNVLIAGLGLGWALYEAAKQPAVERITVLEFNRDLIAAFKQTLLPLLGIEKPVEIVYGDLLAQEIKFLNHFDSRFLDTWYSFADGCYFYYELVKKKINLKKTAFWIEQSILWNFKMALQRILCVNDREKYLESKREALYGMDSFSDFEKKVLLETEEKFYGDTLKYCKKHGVSIHSLQQARNLCTNDRAIIDIIKGK